MSKRYGLLIDYEFCTGCHTCEIACVEEHNFPVGQWGIKLAQIGPFKMGADTWSWDNIPIPTALCDLCRARTDRMDQPACVKHCQAGVMKYGKVEELAKFCEIKSKTVLFAQK